MSTTDELAIMAKSGNETDVLALWQSIKRFTYKQAKLWRGAESNDFSQAGFLALYTAVHYFNPERGNFLSIYKKVLHNEFLKAVYGSRNPTSLRNPLFSASSLDVQINEKDDGAEFGDFLADESAENAFLKAERKELVLAVRIALQELSDRERQIIHARYYSELTQTETAEKLCISAKEVAKLESAALRKLRAPAVSKALRTFI